MVMVLLIKVFTYILISTHKFCKMPRQSEKKRIIEYLIKNAADEIQIKSDFGETLNIITIVLFATNSNKFPF